MQLVIDIPFYIYQNTQEMGEVIDADKDVALKAVVDGTPLPKRRENLIGIKSLLDTQHESTDRLVIDEWHDAYKYALTISDTERTKNEKHIRDN